MDLEKHVELIGLIKEAGVTARNTAMELLNGQMETNTEVNTLTIVDADMERCT